jgi:hypothetical protein
MMGTRAFFLAIALLITSCAPTVPLEQYDAAVATEEALRAGAGAAATAAEATLTSALLIGEATAVAFATEMASVSKERNEAISRASRLQGQLDIHICPEVLPAMDYGSIADASTILAAFVAQQSWAGRVQGTFRNSIWSNADSKIHGVRYVDSRDNKSYTTYFMVYFKEYGWNTGVYWVDRQCWLDR